MREHDSADTGWSALWDERERAVLSVMGDLDPPDRVVPFSWAGKVLPGACALCFPPSEARDHYTYMTLGPTQPADIGMSPLCWEFAINVGAPAAWPYQVLFDLISHWLYDRAEIGPGYLLPLLFFESVDSCLCAGLGRAIDKLKVVGAIRGIYLWDLDHRRFRVSSGEFGLLIGVPVTNDEIELADRSTPAHLMLLLKRLNVLAAADPMRGSVLERPDAEAHWRQIRELPEPRVLAELTPERAR